MPAPVAAVAPVAAAGGGLTAGTVAKVAWHLSPLLRDFVKRFLVPLLMLLMLTPIIAAPFAAVAAQSMMTSLMRPIAASCAEAASGPLAVPGQVVFPLPASTYSMTSPYGMRVHPVHGTVRMHNGTDFGAADGTPILAMMDGVVREVVYPRSGDNYVTIESRDVDGVAIRTLYMHMWPEGIFVEPGMSVRAGDIIATVGNAGTSTGPHLHFEVRVEGERVDPVPFLALYGALELADCEQLQL